MRIAAFPAPYGFGLRPLLLNRIEVRTVRWEKLHGMPFLCDCFHDVSSLVKRCAVQDDDRLRRYGGEECFPHPREEDIGVNVALPQLHCKQREIHHGSNGIQPALRVPVFPAIAAYSSLGISMRSRRIYGKTALIKVDNGTLLDVFMPSDSRLEPYAGNRISFGMKQSFFYS